MKHYISLLAAKLLTILSINAYVQKNKPLRLCAMSVDSLERIIGIDLFSGLDDKIEQTIESQVIYSDWGL